MMISAATPSSTQPKTSLMARGFIRSAISREPSWLPSSTAMTVASQTPHCGCAAYEHRVAGSLAAKADVSHAPAAGPQISQDQQESHCFGQDRLT